MSRWTSYKIHPVCDCETGFCEEGTRHQIGFCAQDATLVREQIQLREQRFDRLYTDLAEARELCENTSEWLKGVEGLRLDLPWKAND